VKYDNIPFANNRNPKILTGVEDKN